MHRANIQNADKNIVERRRSGNQMRQSVRGAKTTDDQEPEDNNQFLPDLILRHARNLWHCRYAMFISIAIGGWISWGFLDLRLVVGWTVGMVALTLTLLLLARKFIHLERRSGVEIKWAKWFNALNLTMGLAWASLFGVVQAIGQTKLTSPIVFACATVLMALALISVKNLRYGVMMATAPIALTVAALLAKTGDIANLGMAAVLLGACVFFEHIGSLMRRSWIKHLQSEIVRDQLIVELEAATAISDEARRRAEEANLAKSRFLATMSHELRTPLNAILGFSEVMSNEVMGPLNNDHYKEYVQDIHSSGSHLLNLINEILDLSRVEAGRYEMNEEPVSLSHAAEESQQMVKLKASKKHISIVMQLQPNLPQINADARAVRQIMLNLLSNALKFTPDGGTIWIKVGWTAGGGQYVSIKDTGPGIPEDEIPVVLSSFGQGSIAIKSAEQGTGLGLPIVQALVHMHEGHFELKSKLREGTEVIATFPRTRVLEGMPPGAATELHRPTGNQGFAQNRQNLKAPPMVGIASAENLSG